jgi:hypothetical protein
MELRGGIFCIQIILNSIQDKLIVITLYSKSRTIFVRKWMMRSVLKSVG